MRAVIIILLVMVAAMIMSLQIANNEKTSTINVIIDKATAEAIKAEK